MAQPGFEFKRLCILISDKDTGEPLRRVPVYAEAVFHKSNGSLVVSNPRDSPQPNPNTRRFQRAFASEVISPRLGTIEASGAIKDIVQTALNTNVDPAKVESLTGVSKLNKLVEAVFAAAEAAGIYLFEPEVGPAVETQLEEIVEKQVKDFGLSVGSDDNDGEGEGNGEVSPGDGSGSEHEIPSDGDTPPTLPKPALPQDTVPLGLLATDHVGFLSFDLTDLVTYLTTLPATQRGSSSITPRLFQSFSSRSGIRVPFKIFIYPNLLVTNKIEVYASTSTPALPPLARPSAVSGIGLGSNQSNGIKSQPERVLFFRHEMTKATAIRKSHMALRLPSLQRPSLLDWKTSPGSFAAVPQSLVGADGCETLTPANFAINQYSVRQIFRVAGDNPSLTGSWPRALVYEYSLSFVPIGHSLGEILYTLPLAPGETTRLAIIDWNRNETSERAEDTTVDERLIHEQSHDRSITETVSVALNEWQRGANVMGGISGGGGASGTMGSYGVAGGVMAAVGGGYTTSSGTRNLAANSMQNIAEVVHQASSSVRELRSTVVVQTNQNEKETIQTKAFANHNRGHTLTVIYYEVLRHFRVQVRLERKYDAILLSKVNDIEDLAKLVPETWDTWSGLVLELERYIKPFLLDASFAGAFDALKRYTDLRDDLAQNPIPTSTPVSPGSGRVMPLDETLQPASILFTHFVMTFDIIDESPNGFYVFYATRPTPQDSQTQTFNVGTNVRLQWEKMQDDNSKDWGADPNLNAGGVVHMNPNSNNVLCSTAAIASKMISPAVYWEDLLFFTLHKDGSDAAIFNSITVEGISSKGNRYLLYSTPDNVNWKVEHDKTSLCLPVIRPGPGINLSPTARSGISKEDYRLLSRFGPHLKRNGHYYNTVVSQQRSTADWAAAFRDLNWDSSGGEKLINKAAPTPLGNWGDMTAFPLFEPLAAPTQTPNTQEPDEIGEEINHLITLPTRGVFAEAKLGHCNVAEEIDETRFWRWDEHPLPFVASDIAPAQPVNPTKSDPTAATQPTNFPTSIVNIQNPTSLPDPTGLANALKVVGTPDIFRNMSGSAEVQKLLKDLTEGAVSMAQAAGKAKEIQNKLETDKLNAQNEALKSNNATDLGMAKILADDRREAAEKVTPDQAAHANKVVEKAKEAGHISDEKASELIEKQLSNIVGNTKPSAKPKTRTFIVTFQGKHGSMPASAIWGLTTPSEEFGGKSDPQATVGQLHVLHIKIEPKVDDPRFILNIEAKVTVPRSTFDTSWDIQHPPGSPEEVARRTFEVYGRGLDIKISEADLKRYDSHVVRLIIGSTPVTVRAKSSDEAMEKVAINLGVSTDVVKAKTWGISGSGGFSWERQTTKTNETEIEMAVNVYNNSISEVQIT